MTNKAGEQPTITLLPCPFCGGEAYTVEHGLEATHSVRCVECLAQMPFVGFTESEAIAAWNTRSEGK